MVKVLFLLGLLVDSSFASDVSHYGNFVYMDPVLGLRTIVYETQDNYAIAEGDIILQKLNRPLRKLAVDPVHAKNRSTEPQGKLAHDDLSIGSTKQVESAVDLQKRSNAKNLPLQAMVLLRLGGYHWHEGVVPYKIAGSFAGKCEYAILEAMSIWQERTKIKFVEVTEENSNLYSDYLNFTPSSSTTSSSFVGRQGGKQDIRIGTGCALMTIAHEIGHALGLWHEQSRADRDEYVKIIWENIDENHRFNFNQHLNDGMDYGAYDYNSIMHYGFYAFSKNGKKTIIPLVENAKIGQRQYLSDKDIAAINAFYP